MDSAILITPNKSRSTVSFPLRIGIGEQSDGRIDVICRVSDDDSTVRTVFDRCEISRLPPSRVARPQGE